MMPAGNGDFYLYLHGDVRRASQTKVGDLVQVEIAFDSGVSERADAPDAVLVPRAAVEERESVASMGRADSEPQKRNSPLLFVAQIARGARAQRGAGDSCIVWKEGPIHGPIVVNRDRNPE